MVVVDASLLVGLFAILPLEHTPGLRYLLCILLGMRGAWLLAKRHDPSFLHRSWALLPWLAWASASYLWSVAPEKTFANLKHDLWIPAFACFGVYQIFRIRRSRLPLLWAVATGTLTNAILTAFGAPSTPYPLSFAQRYYSTVGYSSTYALYFSALALPWLLDNGNWRLRSLALAVVATNLGGALLVESRAFLLSLALLLIVAADAIALRGRRQAALVAITVAVTLIAVFTLVNRDRTHIFTRGGGVGAGLALVVQNEVRFGIWPRWAERALNGPSVGVGFGREVPATTLNPMDREAMLAVDQFAAMHAHNLFLSVWLETGWPGLMFFLFMLSRFAFQFFRVFAEKDRAASLSGLGGLLLIAGMLLKNQTDVFMLFGPAVLFYSALGSLLAWPDNEPSSS
jgi:O-antigen ligase